MRYLFIDTETTGLPLNWDAPHTQLHAWPRIVSISWATYASPSAEPAYKYHVIRPDGFKIPPDAARVHGISTERAIREGIDLSTVLSLRNFRCNAASPCRGIKSSKRWTGQSGRGWWNLM